MTHPSKISAGPLLALGGFIAVGVLTSFPTVAAASAPTCPTTGTQSVPITWGSPSADYPLDSTYVTSGVRLTGLAAGGDDRAPVIRTRRASDGRGTAVLCSKGRVRARLPQLAAGHEIQAASVNGSTLVWRQTKSTNRDTVFRATVRHAKLRDVQRTTVRVYDRSASKGDHRIVAHADGTTAWALNATASARSAATRVTVWPHTGRPKTVVSRAGDDDPFYLRVLDDQNVLLSSSDTPVRYAPATPGKCPRLVDGRYRDLGGWREARFSGWTLSDDSDSRGTDWNVVCDPRTGQYIDLIFEASIAFKGDGGTLRTTHLARSGDWLVGSKDGGGSITMDETVITNAAAGHRFTSIGRTDGPGIDRSTDPNTLVRKPTGAVIGVGFVAFIAQPSDRARAPTLVLSDAAGTRTLATGVAGAPGSITDLATDGRALSWSTGGSQATATITPIPDSPYAIEGPDLIHAP